MQCSPGYYCPHANTRPFPAIKLLDTDRSQLTEERVMKNKQKAYLQQRAQLPRIRRTAVALIVLIFAISPSIAAADTIWQLGLENGALGTNPIETAFEYIQGNIFYPEFTYTINQQNAGQGGVIEHPEMPGLIGPGPLADYVGGVDPNDPSRGADGRLLFAVTQALTLEFNLGYQLTNAQLHYGRYGSEDDRIALDNSPNPFLVTGMTRPDGSWAEGIGSYQLALLDLGDLSAGAHTLLFSYAGGGVDNGHYIDFIRLTGTPGEPIPEPSSLLLLGLGALGLFDRRRKRTI